MLILIVCDTYKNEWRYNNQVCNVNRVHPWANKRHKVWGHPSSEILVHVPFFSDRGVVRGWHLSVVDKITRLPKSGFQRSLVWSESRGYDGKRVLYLRFRRTSSKSHVGPLQWSYVKRVEWSVIPLIQSILGLLMARSSTQSFFNQHRWCLKSLAGYNHCQGSQLFLRLSAETSLVHYQLIDTIGLRNDGVGHMILAN